jgi:hypothetical protein
VLAGSQLWAQEMFAELMLVCVVKPELPQGSIRLGQGASFRKGLTKPTRTTYSEPARDRSHAYSICKLLHIHNCLWWQPGSPRKPSFRWLGTGGGVRANLLCM